MFFAATSPVYTRRGTSTPASHLLHRLQREAARDGQAQHDATVEQDESSTTLRFDVPGVTREQLEIGVEGNVVRIATTEGAPRQYRMAYRLAQEIAAETSSAKLENGVLTVKLAKPAPVDRSTRIAVH
ncbi:Hsp20/alpha crystallin family protein [Comamonadaceae bacterium G21597-S1]|nr:Hsp20/alpha crystallin family protein [Comamonadaceae bacterium G21597-S1]